MNHCLKNILIIDKERFYTDDDSSPYYRTVLMLDVLLVESETEYLVVKNRYGRNEYRFKKHRLPEFLMDPFKDYSEQPVFSIAPPSFYDEHRDEECSCHLNAPCSFCTSLTEEEADLMANGGIEEVRRYRRNTT